MWIDLKSAERAGLEISIDDTTLHINGTVPIPKRVIRCVSEIADQLSWTPREQDELTDYVGNKSVWSALKKLSD